jgi:hypothetical protein
MLRIPDNADCANCGREPTHVLSLRMRRRDTGADWAPNLPVYFCEDCANGGAEITMLYEPTDTGKVNVRVIGVDSVWGQRRVTIKR